MQPHLGATDGDNEALVLFVFIRELSLSDQRVGQEGGHLGVRGRGSKVLQTSSINNSFWGPLHLLQGMFSR